MKGIRKTLKSALAMTIVIAILFSCAAYAATPGSIILTDDHGNKVEFLIEDILGNSDLEAAFFAWFTNYGGNNIYITDELGGEPVKLNPTSGGSLSDQLANEEPTTDDITDVYKVTDVVGGQLVVEDADGKTGTIDENGDFTEGEPVPVDTTAYDALVASLVDLVEEDYTAASWALYEAAIVDYLGLTAGNSTQEQIDEAVAAITAAMALLEDAEGGEPGDEITVVSVNAINYKEVEVTFSEAMDPLTATNAANYVFSGFTSTDSATINAPAQFAAFTDSSNTTVRLILAGATHKAASTDTDAKLEISGVKNADGTATYSSPDEKEALGAIAPDTEIPTVVAINPIGVTNFEVVYSKAMKSADKTNNMARNGLGYKIGTTQLTDSDASASATDVDISNPSGDMRTFLFTFAASATSVVPLFGERTIWVNSTLAANDKVQDFAGNNVPITSRTIMFEEDMVRPELTDAQVISRTEIRLTFSEPVDIGTEANIKWGTDSSTALSAENKAAASSAQVPGTASTYILTFSTANALPTSGTFKLHIPAAEIADLSGNTMAAAYAGTLTGVDSPAMVVTVGQATTISSVVLNFSRALNNASAVTMTNYKIDGAAIPGATASASNSDKTVTIATISPALTNGSHTMLISGLKDEFGVTLDDISLTFSVTDTTAPTITSRYWFDGAVTDGGAKDILIINFNKPMAVTGENSILLAQNYKYVADSASIVGTAGNLPAGTTLTAMNNDRSVKIVMPDGTIGTGNTDDLYLGYLSGTTYFGVCDAAGNPYGTAKHDSATNASTLAAIDIQANNEFVAIVDHKTLTLKIDVTGSGSNGNYFDPEAIVAADFRLDPDGNTGDKQDNVTPISAVVSASSTTAPYVYDLVTLTFPDGTFTAGSTGGKILTVAAPASKDIYGVKIAQAEKITAAYNANLIAAKLTSVAIVDAGKIRITFDGAIQHSTDQAAALKNSLIVTQGGVVKAINTVAATTTAGNKQFDVTLTDSIDITEDVTVKTKSAIAITALDGNSRPIMEDTTGVTSNGLAIVNVVAGNLNSSALQDASTYTITFNRAVNPASIKAGWDGAAGESVTIAGTGTSYTLNVPNVGDIKITAAPADESAGDATMAYNAGANTLVITLGTLTPLTSTNGTVVSFTPDQASTIVDAAGGALDTGFSYFK